MRQTTLDIRGLRTNVLEWGEVGKPKLFMLHGWMDCGATFSYMMPQLSERFHVIAPDLRGFGDTEHAPGGYWFPDYFADLDVLLDRFSPQQPVDLVGHSMGGNIALLYCGISPQRVQRVLSLEALGLPPTDPAEAADKYRKWMREILADEPSRVYPSASMLKHSIYKSNPQLSEAVIDDLVGLWGRPVGDEGAMELKHDHRHRFTNPVRYNFDDIKAIWQDVTAQVGLVVGLQSSLYQRFGVRGRIDEIKEILRITPAHYYELADCGHMMHLERPEQTAEIILSFFN